MLGLNILELANWISEFDYLPSLHYEFPKVIKCLVPCAAVATFCRTIACLTKNESVVIYFIIFNDLLYYDI
jgi:hypothetical protein